MSTINIALLNKKVLETPVTHPKFETFTFDQDRNSRIDKTYGNLVPSIVEVGLEKELVLSQREDGSIVGVRGHLRHAALTEIHETNAQAFALHFKKGIPAKVLTGLSLAEEMILLADHGNGKPLSNKGELFLELEAFGRPEKETIMHLATLLDSVCPLSKKVQDKLDAVFTERDTALEGITDKLVIAQTVNAAQKLWDGKLFDIRRGSIQKLRMIPKLPVQVRSAFLRNYNGEKGLSINETQIAALNKAWNADVEDKGTPSPKLDTPGVQYLTAWKKLEDDALKAATAPKDDTPKRRKASDVDDKVQSSDSAIMQAALQYTQGVDNAEYAALEHLAVVAETVSRMDKKLWAAVEAKYKAICDEQNAATLAAAKS